MGYFVGRKGKLIVMMLVVNEYSLTAIKPVMRIHRGTLPLTEKVNDY